MKCRKDIVGRKIWVDGENAFDTRPQSIDIILNRDGVEYKTAKLSALDDGEFRFPCLIVWKNNSQKYVYTVDELQTPDGYRKRIEGNNIINTLNSFTINGTKTWNDLDNQEGQRPDTVTIRLLQNGVEIDSQDVQSPVAPQNTVSFSFADVPFADEQSVPYNYTLAEDAVPHYTATIEGYNIINSLSVFPFTFSKRSERTQMALEDASFEVLQNGVVQATALSDANGNVSFSLRTGSYQMQEAQPPVGYMDDDTVYQVEVAFDGVVTIDGVISNEFTIENKPSFFIERAASTLPYYMQPPNAWALHGDYSQELYMRDKILITANILPVLVKWDEGIRDLEYFTMGGGIDITDTYTSGVDAVNGDYTVYALLGNGFEEVISISFDRIRDGSIELPYLLIDYETATQLMPYVTGIEQFVLDYMQGGGIKLSYNYELYEDIDMTDREWLPLGVTEGTMPIVIEGFSGSLYGNNNSIKNLTFDEGTSFNELHAFFRAVVDGASIQKLGIENVFIQGSGGAAAVISAVSLSQGGSVTINDVYFSGNIENCAQAGGLINVAEVYDGNLIVDNISSSADTSITASSYTAGIITYCNIGEMGAVKISNCVIKGVINGVSGVAGGISWLLMNGGECQITGVASIAEFGNSDYQGGIVAMIQSFSGALTKISSCYNSSNIVGDNIVGGIVGGCASDSRENNIIENCYNSGNITTNIGYGGGIIGMHSYGIVDKCYNTGSLTLLSGYKESDKLGGIVAEYSVVKNSLSSGQTISSNQPYIARIAPVNEDLEAVLENNLAFENMQVLYNGTQKYPLDEGADATDGLSTSAVQIKTQALYENQLSWDFIDIWSFGNENYTLPILRSISSSVQPVVLPAHLL